MAFKSDEKQYSFGISQKAVIYDPKEEKYLVLKTKDKYLGDKYGYWDLPGGTVEKGEDFQKALEREVEEEAGKINYEIIEAIHTDRVDNSDGGVKICIHTLMYYLDGEVEISDEHSEYKWETAENILTKKEYAPWPRKFIEKAEKYLEKEKSVDDLKRAQADFENFKKRQDKLNIENIKFANRNLIMEIIPVLDNFHASTDHIPEDQKDDGWVTGIMYIQKQLEKVLSDNGVIEIETKVGDKFDPEIHEAMKDKDADGKKLKNKIAKIILKGYKLDERIIRAAKVIVE